MRKKNAIEALAALGQDTRLAVFRMLVRDGDGMVGRDAGVGRAGHGNGDGAEGRGGGGQTVLSSGQSRRSRRGAGGISAGDIAARLKVPPATLSFHLSKLEQAGLITVRRQSLNMFYRVNRDGIRDLLGYLVEDCCRGRRDLCPPRAAPGRRP